MLAKIRQVLQECGLWAAGEPLLVGVSGGADSVALLDVLVQLSKDFGSLTVCHLNHQLRGAASDADAEFVRQLAATYGLPVEFRCRDVKQLAEQKRLSVEMAAREARLEFFEEIARGTGARKIALAHTADDQVETVLLRLIRGAGREGLSAMEKITHYRGGIILIRPMLEVWRREVLEYLGERKLSFREDATNAEAIFLRNRIRHKLLPFLESEFGAGIKETLRRTADILGEEEQLLESLAEQGLRDCLQGDRLQVAKLLKADVALQRRVTRLWLAQHVPFSQLTMERVEAVLRFASESAGSARIDVGGGHSVVREYDALVFASRAATERLSRPLSAEEPLLVPGSLSLSELGFCFTAEFVPRAAWESAMREGMSSKSLTAYFDAEALGQARFTLRTWREGDRFQPLGMSEEKKLQDFFVDEKVLKVQRSRVPLLACGERIVWVVGHRIADWAKVTENTVRVVKITAEPITQQNTNSPVCRQAGRDGLQSSRRRAST